MVTTTRRSSSMHSRTATRARTTRAARPQGADFQRKFEDLVSALRDLFTRSAGERGARRPSGRSTAGARSRTTSRARTATTATRSRGQTRS